MRKEVIQIRCSLDEKDRWNDAAASVGLELSPWIRLVLDRATRAGAPEQQTLTQDSQRYTQ